MASSSILRQLAALSSQQHPSKLDQLRISPEQSRALVEDGSTQYGLLIEALIPDEYDSARARAVADGIRTRIERIRSGDIRDIEADLTSQCAWLAALTAHFTRKASAEGLSAASADVFWKLALKAQQAYARTAAALVVIVEQRARHDRDA